MAKKCWYCEEINNEIADDFLGDFRCAYCNVENSCLNPKQPDWLPNNLTTEEEWLEKGEEEMSPNLGNLKNYLTSEDLQQGDIITFFNEGEIKDIDFSKTQDGSQIKTVFQISIELPDGKNKMYTPNATTREILKAKWGAKTENWVNKKAKANFVKQLAFGKQINVMILEPIE